MALKTFVPTLPTLAILSAQVPPSGRITSASVCPWVAGQADRDIRSCGGNRHGNRSLSAFTHFKTRISRSLGRGHLQIIHGLLRTPIHHFHHLHIFSSACFFAAIASSFQAFASFKASSVFFLSCAIASSVFFLSFAIASSARASTSFTASSTF